jgi:hypothetical protein
MVDSFSMDCKIVSASSRGEANARALNRVKKTRNLDIGNLKFDFHLIRKALGEEFKDSVFLTYFRGQGYPGVGASEEEAIDVIAEGLD